MFMSMIRKRRSIRKFIDKPVEEEKIDRLIEAALRPPSSMGKMPWSFLVVKDRDLLEQLSRAKTFGASFLKNAALGILVCADPEISDVWIEDASIASTYIFLAAESMDLGACWIQFRRRNHRDDITSEEYITGLLDIPERLEVLSIIAIGYPGESKSPHEKESLKYDRVYLDGFGNPYHAVN
jgi:nitroreductase